MGIAYIVNHCVWYEFQGEAIDIQIARILMIEVT